MRTLLSIILIPVHGYFLGCRIDTGDYSMATVQLVCIVIHYAVLNERFKKIGVQP